MEKKQIEQAVRIMRKLREHADWARANDKETPDGLSDDLAAAFSMIGNQVDKMMDLDLERKIAVTQCDYWRHQYCSLMQATLLSDNPAESAG